jgi:predicted negative regulator of RcsB-dependent stress response
VLQNYPGQKFAVAAAHFGLAAVAENRAVGGGTGAPDASQWDTAKAQYQAVLDSNAEQAFKDVATMRMGLLPQLSKPVAIGLSAPSTEPSLDLIPLGSSTRK